MQKIRKTSGAVMNEFEVNCVNKPKQGHRHEHITHIGNTRGGWRMTVESAISLIETKNGTFYTIDRNTWKRAYLGVVREQGKMPYLRTHADGVWNDNLLALAECDSQCRVVG
jgi:hypothetical protein